ncbi:MAG: hypothetical protein LBB21_01350 [Holosporaceae bacterium]|jgi:hypothetical protein|nr:hypothetical protein [Holosporaceae bacterium]
MGKMFKDNVRAVLAGVCCAAVMMCDGVEGMMDDSVHSVVENFYTATKCLRSGSFLNVVDCKFILASLASYTRMCERPNELLGPCYFLFCIHWKEIANLPKSGEDSSLKTQMSRIVEFLPEVLKTALPQKKLNRIPSNLEVNAASFLTDKQLFDIQKILRYCFIETRSQLE